MKKSQELFSSLAEKESWIHVEHGDDAKYVVKGEGTILFQLDSSISLEVEDVLYVLGLKNNFLSDSIMEDRGFSIMLNKWQVPICLKGSIPDTTVNIGVRESNLHMLQGNHVHALLQESDNLCEIWHVRMGYLHYKVFLILREIVTGLPIFDVEQ
jgi:hypothetical protein